MAFSVPLLVPLSNFYSSALQHQYRLLAFRRTSTRFHETKNGLQFATCSLKSNSLNAEKPSPTDHLGPLNRLFLYLFRSRMVQEVGWDSKKLGYDGLIEVSRRLMAKYKSSPHIEEATVRILKSLFPPFLLSLFRLMIAPLADGKVAALMTAKVTQATCQWLMGPCLVNHINLSDGSSLRSGVRVERCKYLEQSKCLSICVHTCKLPTQTFIKTEMGVPLVMEPNFEDFSCQFKFGVDAPSFDTDATLRSKCLDICPTAAARIQTQSVESFEQCPEV